MTAPSPLAAPIDRALADHHRTDASYGETGRQRLRDAILAEIEAEWGPITVERHWVDPTSQRDDTYEETRICSDWRAER